MKELSIEEKAKAYDEALERAKNFIENGDKRERTIAESIFAGLMEESEDERIRQNLICLVRSVYKHCVTAKSRKERNTYILWLEKQGEHANFRNKIQIGDKVTRNEDGVLVNLSQLNRVAKKQGEQKPIPKFKVGDVVRSSNGASLLIVGITDYCYNCVICATNDKYSFGFDIQDEFELVEQKPAWSEEDEEIHRKCICAMRASACGFPEEEKFVEQVDNWLKSLKDRVQPQSHWKPSDEQIIALRWVLNNIPYNKHKEEINGLFEQIKDL